MENLDPLLVNPVLLDNAERLFTQRLAGDPHNPATLRALADLYRKQGKLAQAAETLDRLLQIEPADQQSQYMYAILTGREIPVVTGMRPAPFCLYKNFLPEDYCATLHPFSISMQDKFTVVHMSDGTYNPNIRETVELRGTYDFRNRIGEHVTRALPTVLANLKVPSFEIERTEVKLRAYREGHYFRPHMDNPPKNPKSASRVITYVYFFYAPPRPYTGGDLIVFDTDIEQNKFTTRSFTRLVPENNSIIFFPSENWHCVTPIHCCNEDFGSARFVINGHIHRKMPTPTVAEESAVAAGTT